LRSPASPLRFVDEGAETHFPAPGRCAGALRRRDAAGVCGRPERAATTGAALLRRVAGLLLRAARPGRSRAAPRWRKQRAGRTLRLVAPHRRRPRRGGHGTCCRNRAARVAAYDRVTGRGRRLVALGMGPPFVRCGSRWSTGRSRHTTTSPSTRTQAATAPGPPDSVRDAAWPSDRRVHRSTLQVIEGARWARCQAARPCRRRGGVLRARAPTQSAHGCGRQLARHGARWRVSRTLACHQTATASSYPRPQLADARPVPLPGARFFGDRSESCPEGRASGALGARRLPFAGGSPAGSPAPRTWPPVTRPPKGGSAGGMC
jgi:hypothetical protein